MVRLFPQVVAALVSLSALGYYIGWREASAYYAALGAPWAVSMLPSVALLQLSADIALFIGLSAFFGFNNLATGHVTAKRLSRRLDHPHGRSRPYKKGPRNWAVTSPVPGFTIDVCLKTQKRPEDSTTEPLG